MQLHNQSLFALVNYQTLTPLLLPSDDTHRRLPVVTPQGSTGCIITLL